MIGTKKKSSIVKQGHLFIFEGPNGTGKTTLSREFANHLNSSNISTEHFSFPGNISDTLGKHVYEIHKNPKIMGIQSINPTSLQLLHVAAHIDTIESQILPILNSGRSVVLDRYWWSTWVYGRALGCSLFSVENIVRIEKNHWGNVIPTMVFLLCRKSPIDEEPSSFWNLTVNAYEKLANQEQAIYPVQRIYNEKTIEESLLNIMQKATHFLSEREDKK